MKTLMQWRDLPAEAEEWMARIEAVRPLILRHSDYAEEHGETHPEVMAELFKLGFSRLCVSKAFGGQQLDIRVISQIVQRLAALDASVSWQVMVQVAMGRLADYLPEQAAREIYSSCDGFVVGAIHSGGEAIAVEDGYRVSGKWGFASGSAHADWLVCTATLKQEVADGSQPQVRMFFVPRNECRIIKTWDVLGMRGTGSNHFECNNVWVPAHYCVDTEALKKAPAPRDSLAYKVGYYDFGTIAAMGTVLGVAKGALEYFRDERTVPADEGVAALTCEKTGIVLAQLHTAQLLLEDAISHAQQADGDGLNVRVGLAGSMLNEHAVNAVNQLHGLTGSKGVYKACALERSLRDIHVGSKHFVLSPLNLFGLGKLYLGKAQTSKIY